MPGRKPTAVPASTDATGTLSAPANYRRDPSHLLPDFHLAPADIVIVDEAGLALDRAPPSNEAKAPCGAETGECEIAASLRKFLTGKGPDRPFVSPWQSSVQRDAAAEDQARPAKEVR